MVPSWESPSASLNPASVSMLRDSSGLLQRAIQMGANNLNGRYFVFYFEFNIFIIQLRMQKTIYVVICDVIYSAEDNMDIRRSNQIAAASYSINFSAKAPLLTKASTDTIAKNLGNTSAPVSISQAAQNLLAKAQAQSESSAIGASVDFSNMTPQQAWTEMGNLLKSGKLTPEQSGPLMATIGFAMHPMSPGANGQPIYSTSTQPTDFIALLQSELQGMQSRGDTANVSRVTQTLAVLKSLS